MRDRVKPLVQAGKTAAAVVAARPPADLDAMWGQGFMKPDKFVEIVAQSMTADAKTRR